MEYHVPALLNECIEGLNIQPSGIYVDVTFGGGGHSRAILGRLDRGRLIAFDQDSDASRNRPVDDRFLFLNQNFRFLRNNLLHAGIEAVDGILADLGVSFHQFDEAERGFSFRFEAPLDMRMNSSARRMASDILNGYSQEELARIFREYGDIKGAWRIAGAVVEARSERPLMRNGDLLDILAAFAPRGRENRFYATVFQALRIELNREIEFLKEFLEQAVYMLRPGGRLVVITYHSAEDRVVKNFMKSGNFDGTEEKDFYGNRATLVKQVNRKVIVPSDEEIKRNSRSRSAKLRIAEKI